MSADLRWRLAGLVLLAAALAVGWMFAIQPLREAQAGVAVITYQRAVFLATPAAIVAALFLILGGEKVGALIMRPLKGTHYDMSRGQRLAALAMLVLIIAATALAWFWWKGQVTELGYIRIR